MSVNTDATVFVVDDDEAVRESLSVLARSVGYQAEGYGSAAEFLERFELRRPGCLVLDVRMRGMSGLELQDELVRRSSTLPVIVMTGYGDIPMAVRATRAGAIDFIEKPYRDQVLLDRIQQAIEIDAQRRMDQTARIEVEEHLAQLTPRERQVLDLVIAGKTNKESAAALGISVRAVESHRARVMERMNVRSVAELVRMTLRARCGSTTPTKSGLAAVDSTT